MRGLLAAGGEGPKPGPLGHGRSRGCRAAAGVPGAALCLRRRCPPYAPVLPDCLHLHPFLPAPAPCSWQGLRWGFRPEEVTRLSGEDVLCVLNLSSSQTSPGTPRSCRSTCRRDAARGPALGPCAFRGHRAGPGGPFSRGASGTLPRPCAHPRLLLRPSSEEDTTGFRTSHLCQLLGLWGRGG